MEVELEADYDEEFAEEPQDEQDSSPATPAAPANLQTVKCKVCTFENDDGFTHCESCSTALLESSIGIEAVTLATNAIVNDYNTHQGLYWAPVRRTVSKQGMARIK